jgi:hypothetical protein
MGQSDLIAQTADQAIGEVDQLKRKGFLKQYGFGQACGHIREGRSHLLILSSEGQFLERDIIAPHASLKIRT